MFIGSTLQMMTSHSVKYFSAKALNLNVTIPDHLKLEGIEELL